MSSPSARKVTRADPSGRAYLDVQNLARKSGRDTGELLHRYALEGFLRRLARSPFANRLVLKGGVLLAAFDTRRPTRDIDLAAIALDGHAEHILRIVRQIAVVPVDDGLIFDAPTAIATTIRDDDEYGGVRVTMPAGLARAKIRFHVDINIGDPIHPAPSNVELPCLHGGTITLLGYPLAMVFAEKIVTAIQRGQANTRWRDFADIYLLSRHHSQDGGELADAIMTVAGHRQAVLRPMSSVLDGFADLAQRPWNIWRRRQQVHDQLPEDFRAVLIHMLAFADPAIAGTARSRTWTPRPTDTAQPSWRLPSTSTQAPGDGPIP